MKQRSVVGPVAAIVIGALLGAFAIYGLLHAVAIATDPNADGATSSGGAFGVIIWGGLCALFITLGVKALRRTNRENAASAQHAQQAKTDR